MARQMLDVGLADNGDLNIVDGDFVNWESGDEHQRQLVLNGPGEYKENPTVGVGAFRYLDDENEGALLRKIAKEFARDGMSDVVAKVDKEGKLMANGVYR